MFRELIYFYLIIAIIKVNCFFLSNNYSNDNSKLNVRADNLKSNNYKIRVKRYIGLNKRFKLNKRYQECFAPGDVKGHCKHLPFCPFYNSKDTTNLFDYLCIIEKMHVGVCCPDDIALSGLIGSQIILDLPGGGNDYDDTDNTTGCGIPSEGRSVFNSQNVAIQEWPWIVALYKPKLLMQNFEHQFCGGVLITEQHILSAAHCLQGLTPQEIRVRLGEYDFRKSNETRSFDYEASEIILHKEFALATYANDIAIIKIAKPTSFNSYIWPICLPPLNIRNYENEIAVVAGWGQQSFNGPLSEILLHVSIPVWPHEKCVDAYLQRITDDNICAAAFEGGKDSCLGDSGGPLMYQLPNQRWIVIGIVSWGIGCGESGVPGVYTKVSKYIPWIIQNTISK